jgi:diguanylate cyclase
MHKLLDLASFSEASHAVLRFLRERLGFQLWMVTRVLGDDWIVLTAAESGYGVEEGHVFRWTDSFCSRMVLGQGPKVAPVSEAIPAYAAAPIGRQVPIQAYIGIPLELSDGTLIGTLCAIDPQPQAAAVADELPLLELLGSMLGRLFECEVRLHDQCREAERLQCEIDKDALTGLYNRGGWDRLLSSEESRCRRFGHPACLLSIDLDGLKEINDSAGHAAGDELLLQAATAIRSSIRERDVAARCGGDEFAVLAVECDELGGASLVGRLQEAFIACEVRASIGFAMRDSQYGLLHAWRQADEAMYRHKQRHSSYRTWLGPPRRRPGFAAIVSD